MEKYKLPRKLKKAKKHFYFTQEWYNLDDKKKLILSRRFGIAGIYWMITLQRMSKPYPETKWIRKYRAYLSRSRQKYIVSSSDMKMEAPADEHEAFEMYNPNFEVDKTILHEGGLLEVVPKQ